MGFVWINLNPRAPSLWFRERDIFFGPGLTTRKNAEMSSSADAGGRSGSLATCSKSSRSAASA